MCESFCSILLVLCCAAYILDMENRPCMYTGQVVHTDYPDVGHWNKFKPAAEGLRGVTAWVEREGSVRLGDQISLFVPDQRPWMNLNDLTDFDMNKDGSSGSGVSLMLGILIIAIVMGIFCSDKIVL
jgi:hypothetical protein